MKSDLAWVDNYLSWVDDHFLPINLKCSKSCAQMIAAAGRLSGIGVEVTKCGVKAPKNLLAEIGLDFDYIDHHTKKRKRWRSKERRLQNS